MMTLDTLILKIKRLFKKQIVNDSGIPDDCVILKVRGFKYAYYKENEMAVERFLKSFCKASDMAEISHYKGEFIEEIRMDELFSY